MAEGAAGKQKRSRRSHRESDATKKETSEQDNKQDIGQAFKELQQIAAQREQRLQQELQTVSAKFRAQQNAVNEFKQFTSQEREEFSQAHPESKEAFEAALSNARAAECACRESKADSLDTAAETGCLRCCAEHIAEATTYVNGSEHKSALMKATERGQVEIVKLLLYHQANFTDKDGNIFKDYATEKSSQELLDLFSNQLWAQLITAQKTACNCDGKSHTLIQATERGCLKCCAKYIDQAGKFAGDMTALMKAAKKGHMAVARLLVHKEAKMQTKNGWTALMSAAQDGNLEIARLLAPPEGGMQSTSGWSALMSAAYNGQLGIVELLIPQEAGKQRQDGSTALIYAVCMGHDGCVRALMPHESGLKDKEGRGAMYYAVRDLQSECVALLMESEKEAEEVPEQMRAAFRGDYKTMVQMHDAWRQRIYKSMSIAHFALAGGSERCIRLLLWQEEMQKLLRDVNFSFEATRRDPWKQVTQILQILVAHGDAWASNRLASLYFNGNERCARALRPYSPAFPNKTLKQRLEHCDAVETAIQFFRCAKSVGIIFRNQTVLELNATRKKKLAEFFTQNPIYCKQIELARKQIVRNTFEDEDGNQNAREILPEQQFAFRELNSEAAFNRVVMLASRHVSAKTTKSQRRVQDQGLHTARSKLAKCRMHLMHTWWYFVMVVSDDSEQ